MQDKIRSLIELGCRDQGRNSFQVIDGFFVLTITGNRDNWENLCSLVGVPAHAEQVIAEDVLTCKWISHADQIFGDDGLLSKKMPGYEMRIAQLHAARLWQRGIEQGQPCVIEAGCGIGKGFMYLSIAIAMGKRIAVSTSNKALQMQLYYKDAPFMQELFDRPVSVALAQGKNNYACIPNFESASVSQELKDWYKNTETGNTQEIEFETDYKQLQEIVPNDSCTGKACDFYDQCFYYKAKSEREEADVIILNHMLLALHQLYPQAGILPEGIDVLVVDEAHNLRQYVTNALGSSIDMRTIKSRISTLTEWGVAPTGIHKAASAFDAELSTLTWGNTDREMGINTSQELRRGLALSEMLETGADELWYPGDTPTEPREIRQRNVAKKIRTTANNLRFMCMHHSNHVRWITQDSELFNVPVDVSHFVGEIAGFAPTAPEIDREHCRYCKALLADDNVYILGNRAYHNGCIEQVDIFGDGEPMPLAEWLAIEQEPAEPIHERTPILFTSATLAAPDLTHFMRDCGLPYALKMQADSPFNYQDNSLIYIPNNHAPSGKSEEHQDFIIDEMRTLVHGSRGGAFLLFTSLKNLKACADALKPEFERAGYPVYVQGQGLSKLEISKRFAAAGNAVLFATKSFFEGVDIKGEALRLVVIDKIPMGVPSPYNVARGQHVTEWARKNLNLSPNDLKWYSFSELVVPEAIIDLKQGAGRLIRSHTDRGVIAILDNRVTAARYGREKILPSLPPGKIINQVGKATDFFDDGDSTLFSTLSPLAQGVALYSV